MADSPELHSGGSRAAPRRAPAWSRLLSSNSPDLLLEELGCWLEPHLIDLELFSPRAAKTSIARWQSGSSRTASPVRRTVEIPGPPVWRLCAGLRADDAPPAAALDQAVALIGAWRQAREELARADERLAERGRELDLLQSLGRRSAEARTPDSLFAATVAVLQQGGELDAALTAYSLDAGIEMEAYLARPLGDAAIGDLARRAVRFLGGDEEAVVFEPPRVELSTFDAARGERHGLTEEDLVLLPLMRGGSPVGCLIAVPSAGADERHLRLLYAANNHLTLHLDRILMVREAEADRFRFIVDSMPQGVLLADEGLRVIQANDSAKWMLDTLSLPEGAELRVALDRLGLWEHVDRVRTGKASVAEAEALLEDGRVWSVTVSSPRGEDRPAAGLVIVLADVTESRRLQERLAQSEKMSSLGQLISGVAHELNNPLASVVGYSQLIGAKGPDEKLKERLETLRREAERCRRIVQNLLSFARQREPERKKLSLNQVISDVFALMDYQLRVDDVRLEKHLDPSLPSMHGDAHQLQQVLVNLLSNAQQAIRHSGHGGRVMVTTARADARTLVLEVEDDGPGIPASARSRIFDPFYTTKEAGKGTGLGLFLSYKTVTAHGGTIDAVPGPEGGTVFRITLPLGTAAAVSGESGSDASEPAVATGKILVVEDEEPLARLICDALTVEGHQVDRAGDGIEALERLACTDFDLIISDVKMPGMNGEQFHRRLHALRPDMSRRLLWTSGDTCGDTAYELAATAGLGLLRKPFDLDELRRMVRTRLER